MYEEYINSSEHKFVGTVSGINKHFGNPTSNSFAITTQSANNDELRCAYT